MTTIIAYQGVLMADRRCGIEPYAGSRYFTDKTPKLRVTECQRAAFVFFHVQPSEKEIPLIMADFLDGLIRMDLEKSFPVIRVRLATLKALPKDTMSYIATRDEIYYVGHLADWLEKDELRDIKDPNASVPIVITRLNDDEFATNGSGADYALGIHLADESIPLKKIIPMVSTMDRMTSETFDMVNRRKLKPLSKPVKIRGGARAQRKQ